MTVYYEELHMMWDELIPDGRVGGDYEKEFWYESEIVAYSESTGKYKIRLSRDDHVRYRESELDQINDLGEIKQIEKNKKKDNDKEKDQGKAKGIKKSSDIAINASRKSSCGNCEGCKRKRCGKCDACTNKKLKQKCIRRKCTNMSYVKKG